MSPSHGYLSRLLYIGTRKSGHRPCLGGNKILLFYIVTFRKTRLRHIFFKIILWGGSTFRSATINFCGLIFLTVLIGLGTRPSQLIRIRMVQIFQRDVRLLIFGESVRSHWGKATHICDHGLVGSDFLRIPPSLKFVDDLEEQLRVGL